MRFLAKMEKKLGRFAVPNLYLIMLIMMGVGYILYYVFPEVYQLLTLSPYQMVVNHQYWRLFTWMFTIPYTLSGLSVIFLPLNVFFYYYIGRALESVWGRFMYNLYVLGGALLIDILVLIIGFYQFGFGPSAVSNRAYMEQLTQLGYSGSVSSVTYFILMGSFLGFTVLFGDRVMLLYFVIPVKMKWMAYIDLAYLTYYFIMGDAYMKAMTFVIVADYFLFYYLNKGRYSRTASDILRQRRFKKKYKGGQSKTGSSKGSGQDSSKRRKYNYTYGPSGSNVTDFPTERVRTIKPDNTSIHRCSVCGITEKDNPDMEFRFCSKCNGNYEYCMDHLYTHTHVQ